MAPTKTSTTAAVKTDPPINPAWAASEMPSKEVVPVARQKMMIATKSAASPILVTMNAFKAASLADGLDRKSTRLNSSHANISYAVFCLKKKKKQNVTQHYYRFI